MRQGNARGKRRRACYALRVTPRTATIRRRLGAAAVTALLGCQPSPVSGPPPPTASALPEAETSAPAEMAPPGAPEHVPSALVPSPAATAPGDARIAFDFDDADLPELVRLVSRATGKRFIYSGPMPALHASAHSPDRVTADEAYRAFLSILQSNGLTVVERGRFYQIVPSPGLPVEHGAGR
jgi:general secretion pathway protein D